MTDFTPKQQKAIALLASGMIIAEVASNIGMSEKTIDNWLANPSFKGAVREASQKIFDAAMSQAVASLDDTIACLIEIRSYGSDKDKLAASKILLDASYRWHENRLEQRIADIENRLNSPS